MRIIIKIGSNVLTSDKGTLDTIRIGELAEDISAVRNKNHEIIIVTSGAVSAGKSLCKNLALTTRRKVWAAVGQPLLMQKYTEQFARHNIHIGQCLLLRTDFSSKELYQNFIESMECLIACNIIPILNENDVMAPEDLNFGDNDALAAMAAIALKADCMALLTNQRGLYSSDPATNPSAEFIAEVEHVNKTIEKMSSKEASALGRGGMISKIKAAQHASNAGIITYIADGTQKNILSQLAVGAPVGTKFKPHFKSLSEHERWLLVGKGFGKLVIDTGAALALKKGKSLLFPGIVSLSGSFDKNDIIEVMNTLGVPIAYGKINYQSKEIQTALLDKKSFKKNFAKEIIHRDYMTLI